MSKPMLRENFRSPCFVLLPTHLKERMVDKAAREKLSLTSIVSQALEKYLASE